MKKPPSRMQYVVPGSDERDKKYHLPEDLAARYKAASARTKKAAAKVKAEARAEAAKLANVGVKPIPPPAKLPEKGWAWFEKLKKERKEAAKAARLARTKRPGETPGA